MSFLHERPGYFWNGLRRSVAPVAVALCAAGSGGAQAFPSFGVTEGAVPGTPSHLVEADRMSFSYASQIYQQVGGGNLAGSDDPFKEVGHMSVGSYVDSSGAVASYLHSVGSASYGMYAVFRINGEADPGAGLHLVNASFITMSLTLYLDVNSNTKLSLAGSGANIDVARRNSSDDLVVATSTLIEGQANMYYGMAAGDFAVDSQLTLTEFGRRLFSIPSNFYPVMRMAGTTGQPSNGASLTGGGTAGVTGAGDIIFGYVAEPGSVALALPGLLALGELRRRGRRRRGRAMCRHTGGL